MGRNFPGAAERRALDRWTNEGGAPEDVTRHARRPIIDVATEMPSVPASAGLPSGGPREPVIDVRPTVIAGR